MEWWFSNTSYTVVQFTAREVCCPRAPLLRYYCTVKPAALIYLEPFVHRISTLTPPAAMQNKLQLLHLFHYFQRFSISALLYPPQTRKDASRTIINRDYQTATREEAL